MNRRDVFYTVGRRLGKSNMIKEFIEYVTKFPSEEYWEMITHNSTDYISKYIRYRFPEEDK